jgi:hypothetical protein
LGDVPQLPYSIELHDSVVSSLALQDGVATVSLRPAYIHRDGKGWKQDALLIVEGASLKTNQVEFPVTCADGSLRGQGGPYHNLLNLPLQEPGPLVLELEFFSGFTAAITGTSIRAVLAGAPVFVEDVT